LPDRVWRVAAYPFVGIWVAQALLTPHFESDPVFGGVHLIAAVIGSIVAVIIDWIITTARQPSSVLAPEPRRSVPAAV
jgi:membrane associated rhomboid family serine protease